MCSSKKRTIGHLTPSLTSERFVRACIFILFIYLVFVCASSNWIWCNQRTRLEEREKEKNGFHKSWTTRHERSRKVFWGKLKRFTRKWKCNENRKANIENGREEIETANVEINFRNVYRRQIPCLRCTKWILFSVNIDIFRSPFPPFNFAIDPKQNRKMFSVLHSNSGNSANAITNLYFFCTYNFQHSQFSSLQFFRKCCLATLCLPLYYKTTFIWVAGWRCLPCARLLHSHIKLYAIFRL